MILRVLSIPWFWANYIFLLLVTLPFPMLEITVNGKRVRTAPIWECYYALYRLKVDKKIIIVLLIHIFLTFLICSVVWYLVFVSSNKKLTNISESKKDE